MPSTADDAIADLYQQAAQILGSASGAGTTEHVAKAHEVITALADHGDKVSLGLLPLALVLLILHENYQAATAGAPFRVAYVLGRTAVIAAFIHPWTYGHLCGLITGAAGGHGGWLPGDTLVGSVTRSVDGLKGAWHELAGDDPGIGDSISTLGEMLPLLAVWLVLVCSLLFAYVAGLLLSVSQAVLLSILLAVGKTCITVTLVPGVGLGGSWARALAKVAAWSTIAGVITGLLVHALPDLRMVVQAMSYSWMLRLAGQCTVLAICTFAVPIITENLFAGAAPYGNGALEAVKKGWSGGKALVSQRRSSRFDSEGAVGGTAPGPGSGWGGGGGSGGFGLRPHKVAPSRLRQGLAAAGRMAMVPVAGVVALVAGRGDDRGAGSASRHLVRGRDAQGPSSIPGSTTASVATGSRVDGEIRVVPGASSRAAHPAPGDQAAAVGAHVHATAARTPAERAAPRSATGALASAPVEPAPGAHTAPGDDAGPGRVAGRPGGARGLAGSLEREPAQPSMGALRGAQRDAPRRATALELDPPVPVRG